MIKPDGWLAVAKSIRHERASIRYANMKQKLTGWAQRYVMTLRAHLKPGARIGMRAAQALGRQAVALGLETLELARIHQQALIVLAVTQSKKALRKRAEIFFAWANAPIEATHRAARLGRVALHRLQTQLTCRTAELAVTHRQLQVNADQRKSFTSPGKRPPQGLAESLELQTLLRQLTHRVITAHEEERTQISHELKDEIAQTLLGIQVRLITLKQLVRGDRKQLKNQIASAQRLVVNSAKSVRQFARKLNSPQQTFSGRPLTTL